MKHIAILGFGVVGGGCAELIKNNQKELSALIGEEVTVKRILDLRDFPDSPFADRITHDFNDILNDKEISVVAEVMGGSHPAYEFTVALLKAKKSVVTSNKEVVANYGDEFLALARENGVSYRFEASVGGGIPIIEPIISCVRQNKISEVRGILNGTTNYILTEMFDYGKSFEKALEGAQKNGYCEKNPDADILGLDACRKIVILYALVTGKLISPDSVYTEGITRIRTQDVRAAENAGLSIKLVGRCINTEKCAYVMVAPFMLGNFTPLSFVKGVYNAVEVIGDPIGNVMFYGRGAGADATSSAVVADVIHSICGSGIKPPLFTKENCASDISVLKFKNYIATDGNTEKIISLIGNQTFLNSSECAFITEELSEEDAEKIISKLSESGINVLSRIRVL